MTKTIEIYNRDYCENETFMVNEKPLFSAGVIVREVPHRLPMKSWYSYTLEEAIVTSIEGAHQRRRDGEEFDGVETIEQFRIALGQDLRECKIIDFKNFDPDECTTKELHHAITLNWLVKVQEECEEE